jgi:hypothetical protein
MRFIWLTDYVYFMDLDTQLYLKISEFSNEHIFLRNIFLANVPQYNVPHSKP